MSREQLVSMTRRNIAHSKNGTVPLDDSVKRVPSTNYYDPGRSQLEMDRIFRRVPLVMGFSVELSAPNSYKALDVMGTPVLLLRGDDGVLRSFVNMCSHRGAQVMEEGSAPTSSARCGARGRPGSSPGWAGRRCPGRTRRPRWPRGSLAWGRNLVTWAQASESTETTSARGVSIGPSGSMKRQNTSPKARPSVVSQLGTPGSRCAITAWIDGSIRCTRSMAARVACSAGPWAWLGRAIETAKAAANCVNSEEIGAYS